MLDRRRRRAPRRRRRWPRRAAAAQVATTQAATTDGGLSIMAWLAAGSGVGVALCHAGREIGEVVGEKEKGDGLEGGKKLLGRYGFFPFQEGKVPFC